MNTDQGSQFTLFAWTDRLRRSNVRISMDGKGRFLDNIFVERLWRSLKYECVYLHAREAGSEAKAGVRKWIDFYNPAPTFRPWRQAIRCGLMAAETKQHNLISSSKE